MAFGLAICFVVKHISVSLPIRKSIGGNLVLKYKNTLFRRCNRKGRIGLPDSLIAGGQNIILQCPNMRAIGLYR